VKHVPLAALLLAIAFTAGAGVSAVRQATATRAELDRLREEIAAQQKAVEAWADTMSRVADAQLELIDSIQAQQAAPPTPASDPHGGAGAAPGHL
jgi:hypothetical protein